MIQKLFTNYLPAMLTFIVGMLGVFAQLIINFLSEWKRSVYDKRSIRNNNTRVYYIPLLYLLKEYQHCYSLLNKTSNFHLAEWNYPLNESAKNTYERFRKLYREIVNLSNCQYIPTNKKLHFEIQRFTAHVVITNSLWTDKCEKADFDSCLPSSQKNGYDVTNLLALLNTEITSIQ